MRNFALANFECIMESWQNSCRYIYAFRKFNSVNPIGHNLSFCEAKSNILYVKWVSMNLWRTFWCCFKEKIPKSKQRMPLLVSLESQRYTSTSSDHLFPQAIFVADVKVQNSSPHSCPKFQSKSKKVDENNGVLN